MYSRFSGSLLDPRHPGLTVPGALYRIQPRRAPPTPPEAERDREVRAGSRPGIHRWAEAHSFAGRLSQADCPIVTPFEMVPITCTACGLSGDQSPIFFDGPQTSSRVPDAFHAAGFQPCGSVYCLPWP